MKQVNLGIRATVPGTLREDIVAERHHEVMATWSLETFADVSEELRKNFRLKLIFGFLFVVYQVLQPASTL